MSIEIIQAAIALATKYHAGQFRKWGESNVPYIVHPLRVAAMASGYLGDTCGGDEGIGMAGIAGSVCHDLIEDTLCTPEIIEHECGWGVRAVVVLLTNNKDMTKSRAERKADERERLSCRVGEQRNSLLHYTRIIKMCDRIDNLNTMGGAPNDFRKMFVAESELLFGAIQHKMPRDLIEAAAISLRRAREAVPK